MLSQKIKEKLETEGVCNCVIISIRDDILEMERGYNEALKEVKILKQENSNLKARYDDLSSWNGRQKARIAELERAKNSSFDVVLFNNRL